MRPPSRFHVTILSAVFFAAAFAGQASAGSVDVAPSQDPLAAWSNSSVDLDQHYKNANARVDQRLNVLLTGPTRMECSSDQGTGFETCVVRTGGTPSSIPASLARN
ncbi:MAG: hypothetical protein R3F21_03380 [Myxococcota bacterium]